MTLAGGGFESFTKLSCHRINSCIREFKVGSRMLLSANDVPHNCFHGGESKCYEIAFDELLFISADRHFMSPMHFRGEANGTIGELIQVRRYEVIVYLVYSSIVVMCDFTVLTTPVLSRTIGTSKHRVHKSPLAPSL